MRFKILSDLHIEASSFDSSNIVFDKDGNKVDVLILAGDIAVYSDLIDRHIYNIPEDVQVIYVPGNHEYECKQFEDVIPNLKEVFNFSNWHILNNETIVFGDTRFICSTLWSDLKVNGESLYESNYEQAHLILKQQKTYIKDSNGNNRLFDVEDMLKEFEQSKQYIANELAKDFDGNTVVVTHFAPSIKSSEKQYKQSGFWVSDLTDIMSGADIWCHGHIHSSNEYKEGKTLIVSNPRGYSLTYNLNQNQSFDINKTIKLSNKKTPKP